MTVPMNIVNISSCSHGFNELFGTLLVYGMEFNPHLYLPTTCGCGSSLSIDHCLNCHQWGFTIFRHNDNRSLIVRLLGEVCHQITTEPVLQQLSGVSQPSSANTSNNARLDIKADGFWDCLRQNVYIDVTIFNPIAHSCRNQSLSACYRRHELKKRHHFEHRVIQVEHGCLTSQLFSTSGGMGPSASIFFKRLASRLATKKNTHGNTGQFCLGFTARLPLP